MQKNKVVFLIAILVVVIIGETIVLFKSKSKETEQKNPAAVSQGISKGIENVYVQVRIKKETKDGIFTDSLYYTPEEWIKTTAEDVQKAIQSRVDNWEKVTHPAESK